MPRSWPRCIRQHGIWRSDELPPPTGHLSLAISDAEDEWIVAEATVGEADLLVTGDAALQKLGKRAPWPIVSPRGLWDTLRRTESRR